MRASGAAAPVVARKVADCDATARVRRGPCGDNGEVIAGVVGDGEVTRLLANNVRDDEHARVCG